MIIPPSQRPRLIVRVHDEGEVETFRTLPVARAAYLRAKAANPASRVTLEVGDRVLRQSNPAPRRGAYTPDLDPFAAIGVILEREMLRIFGAGPFEIRSDGR